MEFLKQSAIELNTYMEYGTLNLSKLSLVSQEGWWSAGEFSCMLILTHMSNNFSAEPEKKDFNKQGKANLKTLSLEHTEF